MLKEIEINLIVEPPQTESEKLLASIWSSLLNVDINRIGRHTSFFELGGDSISAIQLVSKCNSLNINLSTSLIFKNPTLALMSVLDITAEQKIVIQPLVVR